MGCKHYGYMQMLGWIGLNSCAACVCVCVKLFYFIINLILHYLCLLSYSFDLPVVIATACNTWGLLIVTVLLGYGLVEVPRSFFYTSRRKYSLQHSYFKAAKLYGDLSEARANLRDVTEVNSVRYLSLL